MLDVEALRDLDVGVAPVQDARDDVDAAFDEQPHQRRAATRAAHDQHPDPRPTIASSGGPSTTAGRPVAVLASTSAFTP